MAETSIEWGVNIADETIENNGGLPGIHYPLWTTGLEALPELTHAQSLVDVNQDDVVDYVLTIRDDDPITYGVGTSTSGTPYTQTGGALRFAAIPEALTTTVSATNQTLTFNGQFGHDYEISGTTNLTTSFTLITNITATANGPISILIDPAPPAAFWKVERQ